MLARPFARKLALGILAVLLSLTLVPAQAAEPYDIYAILPLTGFAAFPGQTISKVLGIVEEVANKRGGIRGRPVHFVIQDDQSSPQVAVQLTNAIIAKKVPLFYGSAISAMPCILRRGKKCV